MEFVLEKDLEHQKEAVQALCDVFENSKILKPTTPYANPIIDYRNNSFSKNISKLQNNINPDYRGCRDDGDYLNVDIKMETGTGKTYVYTNSIFELHRKFGFNKFIIVVPSLPIKAGVNNFISDKYVMKHFSDVCKYNCEIELGVLEKQINIKKSMLYMPTAIKDFVNGSCHNKNKIYVLLVNMQLLTNGKMLTRDDYNDSAEGLYRPYDALKLTHPIVIIDEPHRFSRNQKAYKTIAKELKPQSIIRFGATFPELEIGRGKKKVTVYDYNNLVYNLDSCEAFNRNLIKGIAKEHIESITKKEEKIKIVDIVPKTSVKLQHIKKVKNKIQIKTQELYVGDSLSYIDSNISGLIIENITANSIILSNGQEKKKNDQFYTDIFSTSYQEQMMMLGIQRHLETERINFSYRKNKIKTLSLFFIDDISSYRKDKNSDRIPHLKEAFERILSEQIDKTLNQLSIFENEYRDYLLETKKHISESHAGYFSKDNLDSDENIEKEVYDILHNKKQLISFKNPDNTFNVRRFLFSKWTLKEGWDNPNIFTIVKLRSSGSDISRMQEVGRGLRLPVDEFGNRISNEEFILNYIVDFAEENFAEELLKEINKERRNVFVLDSETLKKVAKIRKVSDNDLFIDLVIKKYINYDMSIVLENRDKFLDEYPEFINQVDTNKIRNANKFDKKDAKIRKDVFNELKDLWNKINQKYLLFYDKDLNEELPNLLKDILRKNVFDNVSISSKREELKFKDNEMVIFDSTGMSYMINKPLPYNEFIKMLNFQTSIPIRILHNAFIEYFQDRNVDYQLFNENTVANIVKEFNEWKANNTIKRIHYKNVNHSDHETLLTYKDGTVKDKIAIGKIGTKIAPGTPCDKYLYDAIAYDSDIEKINIEEKIDNVVVYAKIPKGSISIPTIIYDSYSPDFMYIVQKKDGRKELNIILESKNLENENELRNEEKIKIDCAKLFFEQLSKDGFKVYFHTQFNNKKVINIIKDVLGEDN